jgi:8-amino-7-oxononanoate synthase
MPPDELDKLLAAELDALDQQHLLRRRRVASSLDATHVEIDGRRHVNFASNNYLGLTHHPRVIEAARGAMATHGLGSGAAPLVSGYSAEHAAAEGAIARWKGTEAAVLLPSGFQANHAAVGTLAAVATAAGRSVRFLIDKLAHASLIDAVRSTGAEFRVFPHNGIAKLSRLLREAAPDQLEVVVTESIFSMDGDAADLAALAELKRNHPFILLLDEAHGSGVYGAAGAGYAAELGLPEAVDLSIITLSKALGGVGGAVCGSHRLCDAVVNFGRAYLFSTSLPPAVAAAAVGGLQVLRDEPWRQERVRSLARRVREELTAAGLRIPAGDSPIIPIILGSEEMALAASRNLQERGLLVVAIRPPTVPRGTSRLRVTLSCEHTDAEVSCLIESLRGMVGSVPSPGTPAEGWGGG